MESTTGSTTASIRELTRRLLAGREPLLLERGRRVPAAVLLLLYERGGQEHLLLQRRALCGVDHAGEIGLPGGRRRPGDGTLLDTALRETQEELGIAPSDVAVLGRLDDAATGSTNYVVAPYVGAITPPGPYAFRPDPREVERLLTVPLARLCDEAAVRWAVQHVDGEPVAERSLRYGEHLIWGATARIVGQYLDLLRVADAPLPGPA